MAYKLLSLTAISGEFPTDQLNRLPGSPYYLESVVTALKKDGLLRTYYRDKLRGYRLGAASQSHSAGKPAGQVCQLPDGRYRHQPFEMRN